MHHNAAAKNFTRLFFQMYKEPIFAHTSTTTLKDTNIALLSRTTSMSSDTTQALSRPQLANLHVELSKLQADLESCTGARTVLEKQEIDLQKRKGEIKKEIARYEKYERVKERLREISDEVDEEDQVLWMWDVGRKKKKAKEELEKRD